MVQSGRLGDQRFALAQHGHGLRVAVLGAHGSRMYGQEHHGEQLREPLDERLDDPRSGVALVMEDQSSSQAPYVPPQLRQLEECGHLQCLEAA